VSAEDAIFVIRFLSVGRYVVLSPIDKRNELAFAFDLEPVVTATIWGSVTVPPEVFVATLALGTAVVTGFVRFFDQNVVVAVASKVAGLPVEIGGATLKVADLLFAFGRGHGFVLQPSVYVIVCVRDT
jgi:hypothetical protein